jgi:ketosteroid isomerase-like protein
MTREGMLRHAAEWIAAWNRRDLDRVLEDFAADARFTSPLAATLTGTPVVAGKDALRRYWQAALDRHAALEFRLDHALCDTERQEMVVVFTRIINGEAIRACEFMRFDEEGRQVAGEAMHGAKVG